MTGPMRVSELALPPSYSFAWASSSTTCSCMFLPCRPASARSALLTYGHCSFFIITNLAQNEQQIIRYSALLRGTESAWQALSYGLGSLSTFATVGSVYLNFGLWAIAIFPAWLVVRHFGVDQAPLGSKEDLQVGGSDGETGVEESANGVDEKAENA
jgi:hypothetical protein